MFKNSGPDQTVAQSNENVQAQRPTLPVNPAAFVAAAERVANRRDADAAARVYAADAVVETITDGVYERFAGVEAITRAWRGYLAAMAARDFRVSKRLLAASADTIVNEFAGGFGRSDHMRGVDIWCFDSAGLVVEHRMYTYLRPRPSTSLRQRLLFGLAFPWTGWVFLRAARRAGADAVVFKEPE